MTQPNQDRINALLTRRPVVMEKLNDASQKENAARAQRIFYESELEKIDNELGLLGQGQLCLIGEEGA